MSAMNEVANASSSVTASNEEAIEGGPVLIAKLAVRKDIQSLVAQ